MRKRFLSILTALAITLTLLPAAALASGESVALQYDDYVAAAEVFGASSADDIQISSDGDILEVRTEEGQTYVHAAGVGTATVTVGDQAYTVEVTPAKVNVVLVSGQSNAAGVHGSLRLRQA